MSSKIGSSTNNESIVPAPNRPRYTVMVYIVMAYIVMVDIVMAHIVMVYIVMVYIVMGSCLRRTDQGIQLWSI